MSHPVSLTPPRRRSTSISFALAPLLVGALASLACGGGEPAPVDAPTAAELAELATHAELAAQAELATAASIDDAGADTGDVVVADEAAVDDGWALDQPAWIRRVIAHRGRPALVLDNTSATGAIHVLERGEVLRLERELAADDPARAWIGREVTVYLPSGQACVDRVARVVNLGELLVSANDPAGQSRGELWSLVEQYAGARSLALLASARCLGAELGFDPTASDAAAAPQAAPRARPMRSASPAQVALMEAALPGLATSREHAAAFVEYRRYDERPRWDHDAARAFDVYELGDRTLVSARVHIDGHCGDWAAAQFVLWQVDAGAGAPTLRLLHDSAAAIEPALWFEGPGGTLRFAETPPEMMASDDQGCGC
ncbi:MAG: hypothetical protein KBG28_07540 [Kofleriaceae bacterium]|nr:hypothetical protein [Kofleriaceae bacterium]